MIALNRCAPKPAIMIPAERSARLPISAERSRPISAVVSLGAVVGRLSDPSARADLNATLASDLVETRDIETRRALIQSLGNVGSEENIATLATFAGSDDRKTRVHVASALRHTPTPQSEAVLYDLVADEDARVQRTALRTLGQYPLDADAIQALRARIANGQIREQNFPAVLKLAIQHRDRVDTASDLLATMLQTDIRDRRLRRRIEETRKVL